MNQLTQEAWEKGVISKQGGRFREEKAELKQQRDLAQSRQAALRWFFLKIIFAGIILMQISAAPAQNLFEADGSGNIYEFTANGTKSTFASGLSIPMGLAFSSSG